MLLGVPAHRLQLMAMNPMYRLFHIKKQDGSKRWIEDPVDALKRVQRKLNDYLQSVYFFMAADAAYGFLITAKKDPSPRNILTNAQRHLGAQWLYNVDLADFFHSISYEKVFQLFIGPPFEFEKELAQLLSGLCAFKERLPMGAPTSPVLSNFVCLEMDAQLSSLADWASWTYTRFVDDMSFSAHEEMRAEQLQKIEAIVQEHDFSFNAKKIKLFGPENEKTVTGLRLEEQVKLPSGFLAQMKREILKLSHVLEIQQRAGKTTKWVEKYQQQVEGMLTFATFILGDNHPAILEAEQQMEAAMKPTDEFSAVSWLEFGYF